MTTNDKTVGDERTAFEAFCTKRWGGSSRDMFDVRDDGEYINGRVQFAWSAFQEARASLTTPSKEPAGAVIAPPIECTTCGASVVGVAPLKSAPAEPFGYWHQGATEEESDFFKVSDSGHVGCPGCIALYTHPAETPPAASAIDAREQPKTTRGISVEELADWVAERWHAEVKNRPMVNVHRRALDDTWRQILRHLEIDDRARLGPTHDELRAEISTMQWETMNGRTA